MLETLTMLQWCMPAFLKASSKDCRYSLCLPAPFVRKKYLGIILATKSKRMTINLFGKFVLQRSRKNSLVFHNL